jgi:hypothetical protein
VGDLVGGDFPDSAPLLTLRSAKSHRPTLAQRGYALLTHTVLPYLCRYTGGHYHKGTRRAQVSAATMDGPLPIRHKGWLPRRGGPCR